MDRCKNTHSVQQVKLPTETKHTKNASKDEIQLGKQLDKDKMGEENVSSVRCFHSSEPLPADMTSFFARQILPCLCCADTIFDYVCPKQATSSHSSVHDMQYQCSCL